MKSLNTEAFATQLALISLIRALNENGQENVVRQAHTFLDMELKHFPEGFRDDLEEVRKSTANIFAVNAPSLAPKQ